MAELLKHKYSQAFMDLLAGHLEAEISAFNRQAFFGQVFSKEWENYELKERMTHIARTLNGILSPDYREAVKQINRIISRHRREHPNGFNFEFMFFPEFVQLYGLEDFETSVAAMEEITQFTSCEFVVRHFLLHHPEKMTRQMSDWASHPHSYVRRLASEGMRTRLPWAIKVPLLFDDPQLILPILDRLVNDESEWVRRSVANSLNDLTKDRPELAVSFARKWKGHSPQVDQALKHGMRTLLKNGHPEVLPLFGIQTAIPQVRAEFALETQQVALGNELEFSLKVDSEDPGDLFLRLEYRLYFLRKNGSHNSKTFKISEKNIRAGEALHIRKKHSFKFITTRAYYPGEHYISLVINGNEREKTAFVIH
ncbi:MAG: alkylation repair protein [Crocinitomicaceae bacterium]|jgi:3-methyladenine DNA glycosylase AlkC|nr:alkylation repair protein [Crocinitomicaceae bacterium]